MIWAKFINLQTSKGNVHDRSKAILKLSHHSNSYHECHMSSGLWNWMIISRGLLNWVIQGFLNSLIEIDYHIKPSIYFKWLKTLKWRWDHIILHQACSQTGFHMLNLLLGLTTSNCEGDPCVAVRNSLRLYLRVPIAQSSKRKFSKVTMENILKLWGSLPLRAKLWEAKHAYWRITCDAW